MSPNQLLLQQGDHHPATGQPYYLLRPATVTAMTGNDNDTTNDASNANLGDKNVVLDEVHAAWYNAQLNGLETISGFGGVGGELIQENFQEQLPVTPILLDQNGNVKKEEDVKEENQLATVVSVYVPPPELPVLPAEPIVLGIGEIPPGFETKQDRRELLDRTVQKLSEGNQPMRMDLATRNTMRFIDGKIEGLFETYVPL